MSRRSDIRCKNPECRIVIAFVWRRKTGDHFRLENGAAFTPEDHEQGIICPACGWLQYPNQPDAINDEAA